MALKRILIDTNAYAAFKLGDPAAIGILRRAPEIGICSTVLGELLAGFACGNQPARNRRELTDFLASPRVRQLPVDLETAEHYGVLFAALRRRGRPMPTNDLWIAAAALQYGYSLFSYDAHFREIENLIVGSQLDEFLP